MSYKGLVYRRRMKRILIAALLAAPCFAAPAMAQPSNPASLQDPAAAAAAKSKNSGRQQPAQPAAPSALPGARAEPNQVAPATKNAMDMPPNDALFDAINRGDMATAKDAVNRGADLGARNVLGLTPIELAVDLGRNQLSFYLLSLRGASAGVSSSRPDAKPLSPAEQRAADKAAQRDAQREAQKAAQKTAQAERSAQRRNAVADAQPAAPQTARLFVGGGGAANPQAGFLGFDANR